MTYSYTITTSEARQRLNINNQHTITLPNSEKGHIIIGSAAALLEDSVPIDIHSLLNSLRESELFDADELESIDQLETHFRADASIHSAQEKPIQATALALFFIKVLERKIKEGNEHQSTLLDFGIDLEEILSTLIPATQTCEIYIEKVRRTCQKDKLLTVVPQLVNKKLLLLMEELHADANMKNKEFYSLAGNIKALVASLNQAKSEAEAKNRGRILALQNRTGQLMQEINQQTAQVSDFTHKIVHWQVQHKQILDDLTHLLNKV